MLLCREPKQTGRDPFPWDCRRWATPEQGWVLSLGLAAANRVKSLTCPHVSSRHPSELSFPIWKVHWGTDSRHPKSHGAVLCKMPLGSCSLFLKPSSRYAWAPLPSSPKKHLLNLYHGHPCPPNCAMKGGPLLCPFNSRENCGPIHMPSRARVTPPPESH